MHFEVLLYSVVGVLGRNKKHVHSKALECVLVRYWNVPESSADKYSSIPCLRTLWTVSTWGFVDVFSHCVDRILPSNFVIQITMSYSIWIPIS
jgi:hypothetical protein